VESTETFLPIAVNTQNTSSATSPRQAAEKVEDIYASRQRTMIMALKPVSAADYTPAVGPMHGRR